ncbi:MAG: HEAT repeat domain-containing protein [Acidobacteriota bacterium]
MDCKTARQNILMLHYGEIDPEVKAELERHFDSCRQCASEHAEERRLQAILAQRTLLEPTTELLSRCRQDLSNAIRTSPVAASSNGSTVLDRILAWPHRLWAQTRVSPAFATALLVVGFLAGSFSVGRLSTLDAGRPSGSSGAEAPTMTHNLRTIQTEPGSDIVRLGYDTSGRASLQGTIDDPAIRTLLLSTRGENINADLRLAAIDLLRDHADDPKVRGALLRAIGADANPAARLKALDALRDRAVSDAHVRGAVTRALLQDENPGVRVRAFDALVRSDSPEMMPIFERLAREDPNEYVRMRSAAVVDALYRPEDR